MLYSKKSLEIKKIKEIGGYSILFLKERLENRRIIERQISKRIWKSKKEKGLIEDRIFNLIVSDNLKVNKIKESCAMYKKKMKTVLKKSYS